MKITIIVGSHHEHSQTRRVSDYIKTRLTAKEITIDLIDLSVMELPFIASKNAESDHAKKTVENFKALLQNSDGFVVATPEWDGGATPGIMNALAVAGKTLAYKPTMIVSISASRGGSYPVAELRSFAYKNNKTIFVPDHVIIHDVEIMLHETDIPDKNDSFIRERIDWSLDNLILFAQALKPMREENSAQLLNQKFANGMS